MLAVHQVIKGWTGEGVAFPGDAEIAEHTRAAALEATNKVLAGISGPHPEVTVEAVSGIPAEAMLKAAATAGADLIVLGSRGTGGFARLTIGSVSDQVVRHAVCPVVIVPLMGEAAGAK